MMEAAMVVYFCHSYLHTRCCTSPSLSQSRGTPGSPWSGLLSGCCNYHSRASAFASLYRWADLPAVDQETAGWAVELHMQLSGDPAYQYSVGAAASTDSEAKSITEVQRLRCIIDDVNSATAVQPKVIILYQRLFGCFSMSRIWLTDPRQSTSVPILA